MMKKIEEIKEKNDKEKDALKPLQAIQEKTEKSIKDPLDDIKIKINRSFRKRNI